MISRNLKSINICDFKTDLKVSLEAAGNGQTSGNVQCFDAICTAVLDKHAPSRTRQVTDRSHSPWFSLEEKQAKQERRRAERQSKKTGLQIHKDIYVYLKRKVTIMCNMAKQIYFNNKFNNVKTCQELYRVRNELFGNKHQPVYPSNITRPQLPAAFLTFFRAKVENIRGSLEPTLNPSSTELPFTGMPFDKFREVTEQDVAEIILKSPTKSCDLDPLPTYLLKDCINDVITYITEFVNASLAAGSVDSILKRAIIRPSIKKAGLDQNELKNYRPVSNLTFLSKVLEKIVLKQLLVHLESNGLQNVFQSAYKKFHSTETALLKVFDDLINGIDTGSIGFLNLLDLSAAFDTIDHGILLNRLQTSFGMGGTVIDWFKSYLSGRQQWVKVEQFLSDVDVLNFGVPQGSVLGPVLYTMYTYPLSKIIERCNMNFHFYADDTQLYKSINNSEIDYEVKQTEECISHVKKWMSQNKLKLNDSKTEFIIVGKPSLLKHLDKPSMTLDDVEIKPAVQVTNLGVVFDEELNLSSHVASLCQKMFAEIRNIGLNRKFLTDDVASQLMVSLVLSKMDYCNSILAGIPQLLLSKLQRVQNCAAKVCMRKKKSDHVTPLLKSLHWLPVSERINYKIAMMVFKHFQGTTPSYISDLLQEPPKHTHNTRSSSDPTLLGQPVKKLVTYGERSFQYYGPLIWNSLPRETRELTNETEFKKALKTHLFLKAY